MKYDDAAIVDGICYSLKLSDFPRGQNRALINSLCNGYPPYTDDEVRQNGIEINTSDLASTRLAHDARQQLYGAFMRPDKFFSATTDMGPSHKRQEWNTIVTKEVKKVMKRSLRYFETFRSKLALLVLHGIGPASWDNRDGWCPDELGIEDVLVPSGTLVKMTNIPYIAIHRSYTSEQLRALTTGPNVDPGWNIPLVNKARKWVDDMAVQQMGTTWPDIWSPEKWQERLKSNDGLYAADSVPSVEVYDFYYWNDEGKEAGWNRRMIFDAWGFDANGRLVEKPLNGKGDDGKNQFLFNPGKRKYGSKLNEIASFQFADLSAVAPFRYHSVRSLGFLIYAPCHLQNRLHCKFNEAVFENLMMYLRVKSLDEAERALKIELVSKGIIDETVQFLSPGERWQVNYQLAELGLQHNQRIIQENSASYVQNQNFSRDRVEKTKFQVMAEVNAMTALISAALLQAYEYQKNEYYEIFRRFCKKNSRDVDVRTFRNQCLKQGVPDNVLVPEAWEIEPERVLGAGNKTLEMTMAQLFMEHRHLYDPESQRRILRKFTLSISDDPGLTDELVPAVEERVTQWSREAQTAVASIMDGVRVEFEKGCDRIQICEAWLTAMTSMVQAIEQQGGMTTPEKAAGLQNLGQHIAEQIQLIAQDKNEKERVRRYADTLGQLMNLVKAYQQRIAEQMAKQNGQAQLDPEKLANIQLEQMKAQAKIQTSRESHAARTAQKQTSWELEEKRKQEDHQIEMERELQRQAVEDTSLDIKTAAEVRRENVKTAAEINKPESK
jgi:hypothetical protein